MLNLPRVFKFEKHKVIDFKEYLSKHLIEIHLVRNQSSKMNCSTCNNPMEPGHGSYKVKVQHMPIFTNHCYIIFRRQKGFCKFCKKVRTEKLNFLSKQTPHKTLDYAWWVGRMCEISPVAKVARILKEDSSTTWRLDYKRMKAMLSSYRIPKISRICVDEVYARRKLKKGETRDDLFITVICDLDTRRVIWTSSSRRKEALDEFFLIIGKNACEKILVVAADMHDAYGASVKEHCSNATLVWDRFHVMQSFDNAVNETRKTLHGETENGSNTQMLSRGKYRFLFIKKASRRDQTEQRHISDLMTENEDFFKLELVKERMHDFFNARSVTDAREIFDEIGGWIWQSGFTILHKWHNYMTSRWETLKNYFIYRVSSGLAEGMNHVIKTLKRSGYGYRNMHYFKLKILQMCGYLNSKYITDPQML